MLSVVAKTAAEVPRGTWIVTCHRCSMNCECLQVKPPQSPDGVCPVVSLIIPVTWCRAVRGIWVLGSRGTDSAAGAEALWLVLPFLLFHFAKSHVTCLISGLASSMRTARCQTGQVHVKTQGPAEQLGGLSSPVSRRCNGGARFGRLRLLIERPPCFVAHFSFRFECGLWCSRPHEQQCQYFRGPVPPEPVCSTTVGVLSICVQPGAPSSTSPMLPPMLPPSSAYYMCELACPKIDWPWHILRNQPCGGMNGAMHPQFDGDLHLSRSLYTPYVFIGCLPRRAHGRVSRVFEWKRVV